MPIYDYQCSSCGHKDEVMRKVSAPSVEACPSCGAETFSKQLSAPSFQLNGTGWYATDFKNSGKPAVSAPMNANADTKTTETKPAEAAPSAACATGCACH